MANLQVVVELTNNRKFTFLKTSAYAPENQSEAENFVKIPIDFLVMRSATQIWVFAKGAISQIRFIGAQADINTSYGFLVGS